MVFSPADLERLVRAVGEPALDRGHVGLAIGVLAGDEVVSGFGRARDVSPEVRPGAETLFEIGSITKVFTGLLLADMAREGFVGLDDPLDGHLPEGMTPPARDVPITLAELASHSAGLPREPKGTVAKVLRRPLHPYQGLLEVYAASTVEDVYASLARTKVRPRGSRARYSNVGAGVLGNILATRAGVSYEDVVRRRICLPLGMEDTFVSVPDAVRPRLADGHTRRGRPRPPFADAALVGAGSLRSTAADMLRFLRANIDPPDAPIGAAIEMTQRTRARMRGRIEAGLGWLVAPLGDGSLRMLWYNGGTGGFRSFAGLVRETETGVVVLGNTNRSVDLLGLRLLETLNDDHGRRRRRRRPSLSRR